MPNIIFCKFCIYWWLGATLIPFSAWSDASLLRTREEHAQSRRWRVMGILPKLLGVPELRLQSFCSLTVSLVCEDLKTNGLEARRWPGLALGVASALWDLCGCFCDTPQKHLPRHQRKLQRKMIFFFLAGMGSVLERVPGTGRRVSNRLRKPRCLSVVFIPSCAYLPKQAGIFSWWQPLSDCLCEGKYHLIWEM